MRKTIESSDKVKLILAKVEILKLKADSYIWQCHVSKDVKEQLEKILIDIDEQLNYKDGEV
jgi:hypothetical protein